MRIPAELPAPKAEAGPAPAAASGHVLIVDDEPQARAVIADALAEAGYASREAGSGAAGLAMARETKPRAIVLDVLMPRRDGWSVLRELKADPELCEVPVILSTVLADRELGMALGAVEYLGKPVDPDALISVIRALGSEQADVLIVDDDIVSRNLLRRILAKEGLRIHEATDGVRGLEAMRSLRPDIVLLDLVMGDPDGFAVLNRMKQEPDLREIPVIVVTSKDLTGAEKSWLREHTVSVINKDANTRAELVEALRRRITQVPPPPGVP
jgi:CheY-like chemotaxis protein